MLMLSSVNLPGGVEEEVGGGGAADEGDLISTEVQNIYRSPSLHMRSLKYGKLELSGQCLSYGTRRVGSTGSWSCSAWTV